MAKLTALKKRILDLSKKHGLSHVGSNLSAVDILDEVYPLGEVVLSAGHAGLALFVVQEKYEKADAEKLLLKHGIHAPMFGSLGHGLPIAVGKALADRKKQIYCVTSDGEMMEGSMWEALRIAGQLKLKNLHILVNANGYGGLKTISRDWLVFTLGEYCLDDLDIKVYQTNNSPLKGLKAHYEKVI